MALKLYERYPQLWESPSNDYPQGAFKNLSAQGETDGSYLEKDWLNDYSGFFGALLRNAEMTPDGTVDTAQRSQFYDALIKVAKSAVADQGYATKTYVDNKFNKVPKTEIINNWDQASDENVFSAGFVKDGLGGMLDFPNISIVAPKDSNVPNLSEEYRGLQGNDLLGTSTDKTNYAGVMGIFPEEIENRRVVTPLNSTTSFVFFTVQTQPYMFPPVKRIDNSNFLLPLQTITKTSYDTPYLPSDFEVSKLFSRAATTFRFTRPYVSYGNISGVLNVKVRIATRNNRRPKQVIPRMAWLLLNTDSKHPIEHRNGLGLDMSSINSLVPVGKLLSSRGGRSASLSLSYEDALSKVSNTPPLDVDILSGQIEAGTTDEVLPNQTESQKTTAWIPTNLATTFVMQQVGGKGSVCRIQWKDYSGNIYYDSVYSSNPGDADMLYHVHPEAEYFRVYFRNTEGTATSLKVWELGKDLDPYYGLWATYTFNINKNVVFHPDYDYSFNLRFITDGEFVDNVDSYGVFIESGGIDFSSSSNEDIQKYYNNWSIE